MEEGAEAPSEIAVDTAWGRVDTCRNGGGRRSALGVEAFVKAAEQVHAAMEEGAEAPSEPAVRVVANHNSGPQWRRAQKRPRSRTCSSAVSAAALAAMEEGAEAPSEGRSLLRTGWTSTAAMEEGAEAPSEDEVFCQMDFSPSMPQWRRAQKRPRSCWSMRSAGGCCCRNGGGRRSALGVINVAVVDRPAYAAMEEGAEAPSEPPWRPVIGAGSCGPQWRRAQKRPRRS